MSTQVVFRLNPNLYLRDPSETELGRAIIEKGAKWIDEKGFEILTFKKLAGEINSTEASVYRYFENKHRLLLYLVSLYWVRLHQLSKLSTANIVNPVERLQKIVAMLCSPKEQDMLISPELDMLRRIVIAESSKSYLIKEVDALNKEGLYLELKGMSNFLAEGIKLVNPAYPFPNALAIMIIDAIHNQHFFMEHLPTLSNFGKDKLPKERLNEFAFGILMKTITPAG